MFRSKLFPLVAVFLCVDKAAERGDKNGGNLLFPIPWEQKVEAKTFSRGGMGTARAAELLRYLCCPDFCAKSYFKTLQVLETIYFVKYY